jgi:hypothetical protein
VLLVDDVVAGAELERVDLLLAAGRHRPHVAGGSALPGQVLARQEDEPVVVVDEAVSERAARHRDDVVGGLLVEGVDEPGRHVTVPERLDGPLGRSMTGVDHDRAVAGAAPLLEVGEGPVDVTAVGVDHLHGQGSAGDAVVTTGG